MESQDMTTTEQPVQQTNTDTKLSTTPSNPTTPTTSTLGSPRSNFFSKFKQHLKRGTRNILNLKHEKYYFHATIHAIENLDVNHLDGTKKMCVRWRRGEKFGDTKIITLQKQESENSISFDDFVIETYGKFERKGNAWKPKTFEIQIVEFYENDQSAVKWEYTIDMSKYIKDDTENKV